MINELPGLEMPQIISTISYNQDEILKNIIKLYCPNGFDCDPTYSKGNFYKRIPGPEYKFDLKPIIEGVTQADCCNLPLGDNSLQSLVFDPPFIGGSIGTGKMGIIKERFGIYKNIPTLWDMYRNALREFHRVLKPNGVLVFKCQDSVESGKQFLSQFRIIKDALSMGFYPKDVFILMAKSRLVSPSQRVQQHARKFHSYFLVFINTLCPVNY